jgi:beta-glucanase (GH16 family)
MTQPQNYVLVWSDEFDGSVLDETKWALAYGSASVADSILSLGLTPYTYGGEIRARLSSGEPLFSFRYGYVEVKMKLAFDPTLEIQRKTHRSGPWLANADWNAEWGGEIDITETGSGPTQIDNSQCGGNKINSAIHRFLTASPYTGPQYTVMGRTYVSSENLSGAFHIYGMEWTPNFVCGLLDGEEIWRISESETPIPGAFMFPLLGMCPRCWPLYGPDNPYSSPCPSDLPSGNERTEVDYIRIYQFQMTCGFAYSQ